MARPEARTFQRAIPDHITLKLRLRRVDDPLCQLRNPHAHRASIGDHMVTTRKKVADGNRKAPRQLCQ